MFLFVCHASEDRDDFVRPLAEALRKEYEKVWYSEYELTLGDSLLEKIDQGLASCDFGIVVLSKPFFEKKWPRAELDGLFARETRSHKMILPIWKILLRTRYKLTLRFWHQGLLYRRRPVYLRSWSKLGWRSVYPSDSEN
jgi:hypothetical protein